MDQMVVNSSGSSISGSTTGNLFGNFQAIVSESPVKQSLVLSQDIQKFLSILNRNKNYQIVTNKRTQECIFIKAGIKYINDWDWIGFQPLPVKDKLEENKRGGNQNVAALSCLFTDFDGIDFSNYTKDGWLAISQDKREEYKKVALEKIRALEIKPSAIIDSGGGYYCFWFIKNPIILNIDNRQPYNDLLHDWAKFVGSDNGAADLAHVLGLPGSKNYKYSPPQKINLIEFNEKLFYEIDDFIKLIPKKEDRKQKDENYKGGYSLENDLFATTQLINPSCHLER